LLEKNVKAKSIKICFRHFVAEVDAYNWELRLFKYSYVCIVSCLCTYILTHKFIALQLWLEYLFPFVQGYLQVYFTGFSTKIQKLSRHFSSQNWHKSQNDFLGENVILIRRTYVGTTGEHT
jgi:hypothetical protein